MMYMPSIWGENLFDDFFNDFGDFNEREVFGKRAKNLMKTDIREHDNGYELLIDLPGYKKEDLKLELKNGYLNISAAKNNTVDEKDKKGKMIRQERYTGAVQRSFFVGEEITQEDIKAKFEDGVLKLTVPKKETKKLPESQFIQIEG